MKLEYLLALGSAISCSASLIASIVVELGMSRATSKGMRCCRTIVRAKTLNAVVIVRPGAGEVFPPMHPDLDDKDVSRVIREVLRLVGA